MSVANALDTRQRRESGCSPSICNPLYRCGSIKGVQAAVNMNSGPPAPDPDRSAAMERDADLVAALAPWGPACRARRPHGPLSPEGHAPGRLHRARPGAGRGHVPDHIRQGLAGAAQVRRPRGAVDLAVHHRAQHLPDGGGRASGAWCRSRISRKWPTTTAIPWCSGAARPALETAGQAAAEYDVAKLLEQLPEPYRRVVVLFYLEDRSCEEVGELLSMPTGTVKALLHRGRKTTRRPRGRDGDRIMTQTNSTSKPGSNARCASRSPCRGWIARSTPPSGRASRPRSQRATQPALQAPSACRVESARWLFVINIIGIVGRSVLALYLRAAAVQRRRCRRAWTLPMPEISARHRDSMSRRCRCRRHRCVAVAFGLMFTPFGRRVRSTFT